MMMTMKKRILQNAQCINEEVFIAGIFVLVLASLIAFPTSNIASVFALGGTQHQRVPYLYTLKKSYPIIVS
jgi:hypothetical protein